MNISIIGSGYVGLTTALSFCDYKNNVLLCDIDRYKIKKLKNGETTFYEKGLSIFLKKFLKNKKIQFTTSLNKILEFSDIIFLCVGTPSLKNGNANLKQLYLVINQISKILKKKKVLVIKSTVPPLTTDNLKKAYFKNKNIFFANNPEFLREGSALNDSLNPDRIIVGYDDNFTKNKLMNVYKNFFCKKFFVNFKTSEMAKYASNYFLSCMISASNELSNVSSSLGDIDYDKILTTIKEDRRWNTKSGDYYPSLHNYLIPGPGFAGSCFQKDLKVINFLSSQKKCLNLMSSSIIKTNNEQYKNVIKKLKILKLINKNKKILILGIAFKENTDDIRETRTLPLVKYLKNKAKVFVYKDYGLEAFQKKIPECKNLKYISDFKKIKFDTIIIMNREKKYNIIVKNIIKKIPQCYIYDTRGLIKKFSHIKNYSRY